MGEVVRAAAGRAPDDARPAVGATDLAHLVAAPFWTNAEAAAMMRPDGIRLDDLCARAVAAEMSGPSAAPTDFAI